MKTSATFDEVLKALRLAQTKFGVVAKDKTAKVKMKSGGEYSYTYANLSSILDAVIEPLRNEGLLLIQTVGQGASNMVTVESTLAHISGQWISEVASMPVDAPGPQAVGSAITYCRRYSVTALLGLAPDEDDDAQLAEARRKASYSPGQIAWEGLDEDERAYVTTHAMEILAFLGKNQVGEAVAYLRSLKLDEAPEVKSALWSRFDSKQRAAMDKEAKRIDSAKAGAH